MSQSRVLVAHNFYDRSVPSGENSAVLDDVALLRQAGLDVREHFTYSDSVRTAGGRVRAARATLGTTRLVEDSRRMLMKDRPDVVHVHNLVPLIGPSLLAAARIERIPVVQTVHNRRLACAAGSQFRDGEVCTLCAGHRVQLPAVRYACYRSSRAQSSVVVAARAVRAGLLLGLAHYFAVSSSVADVLAAEGVPVHRISVKPNPTAPVPARPFPQSSTVLFAARLDTEKGLPLLIDAWESLPGDARPRLIICGSGPLEGWLAERAMASSGLVVEGQVSRERVAELVGSVSAVAVPSVGGEGLPRLLAEAFSAGRPVVTVNREPLSSLVGPTRGWVAEATCASLGLVLREIATSAARPRMTALGAAAREYYAHHFAPEVVLRHQLSTYARVMGEAT